MTTYRYQNKTKEPLALVGIGVVKPGEFLESLSPVENPHLTPVTKESTRAQ
jgi:hypothetical protein